MYNFLVLAVTRWSVVAANRVQLMEPLLAFLEARKQDFAANVIPAARDPKSPFGMLAGPSAHTGFVAVGRIEVGKVQVPPKYTTALLSGSACETGNRPWA